jgi:hypothetical protein
MPFILAPCRVELHGCGLVEKSQYRQSIQKYVRFEVFMAVTMKNGVFWDVTYSIHACIQIHLKNLEMFYYFISKGNLFTCFCSHANYTFLTMSSAA